MSGWPLVQLGELCDVLDSLRRPITKRDRLPGPIPYYGASGVLDHVEGQLFDERLVLLGEDGAKWEAGANSAFEISGPSWVNNHAHVIRPRRDRLDDAWLIYYLNFANLLPFVTGLTVPKLNQEMMRSIPIPLPPLAEQQRIVAILDEAFEGIEGGVGIAREALAASQDLLRSAVIASIQPKTTDLDSETLGELCDIYQPKTISTSEMDADGPYPVFGANGQIGRYRAYNHEEPQLLVTCRGATCGKVNVSLPRSWITGNAMVVRPKSDRLSARFLRRLFEYGFDFGPVITGSAQPQITRQSLAPSVIEFPVKISDQEDAADRIERLVETMQAHQDLLATKLALLAELKQSLLARAFSGELTREPIAA